MAAIRPSLKTTNHTYNKTIFHFKTLRLQILISKSKMRDKYRMDKKGKKKKNKQVFSILKWAVSTKFQNAYLF